MVTVAATSRADIRRKMGSPPLLPCPEVTSGGANQNSVPVWAFKSSEQAKLTINNITAAPSVNLELFKREIRITSILLIILGKGRNMNPLWIGSFNEFY